MTQKELLYVEDAYNHEKNIIDICNTLCNYTDDNNTIDFISKEIKKHENMKNKLYKLMENKANG